MMSHYQMVRLLAESYAVLDEPKLQAMSESMDLPVEDVKRMFRENEREWEFQKDYLRKTGRSER